MLSFLQLLNQMIWLGPLMILMIFVGLYQTWSLKGIQFRYFKHACGLVLGAFGSNGSKKTAQMTEKSGAGGDVSSFEALMTALAGAIGTGNITGIATAVAIGGFGSLFWMWMVAFIGMATAYSEATLSVRYRQVNPAGEMSGGPMYTLLNGLKSKKLALAFAFFGAIAAFGIGCLVQSNSVADAIYDVFPFDSTRWIVGISLLFIVGAVILGGIRSIGSAAGVLVPVMAIGYLCAGLVVLVLHYNMIPSALILIVKSAFTGQAAVGAFAGSSTWIALQFGFSNGVFANEAGLGSLSIAAASAQTDYPAKQGMYAICGVFISTLLICTLTGLVLAVTDVLGSTSPTTGLLLSGSPLAMAAFSTVIPWFRYVVVLGLIFFAFTTILAWGYYGEKCIEFLCGIRSVRWYRYCYLLAIFLGSVLELDMVWALANIANGLMAPLNLYSVFRLSNQVKQETAVYISQNFLR